MMIKEKTNVTYAVSMTIPEFETYCLEDGEVDTGGAIADSLLNVEGVYQIECHPHFGSYLVITMYSKYDTKETWKAISDLLGGQEGLL